MAAAKGWKAGKKIELATSAQITAWRERLDTEGKSQKVVNMAEIDKLVDKLDMKNTYLHQFKKEDVKERELIEEQTCSHVTYPFIITVKCSSNMTWPRATLNKTTARSASTRASGANTERRGRSSSRSSVPHSPRKEIRLPLYKCRT
jgi:hypothetical protein